jgi:hypothetical protein
MIQPLVIHLVSCNIICLFYCICNFFGSFWPVPYPGSGVVNPRGENYGLMVKACKTILFCTYASLVAAHSLHTFFESNIITLFFICVPGSYIFKVYPLVSDPVFL